MDNFDLFAEANKTEEDEYFESVSEEELKVNELIKRLRADGRLADDQIIQIGAQSGWLWMGTAEDFKVTFHDMATKEYVKVKRKCREIQKAIDHMMMRPPLVNKSKIHNMAYISEFAMNCYSYGKRLKDLDEDMRYLNKAYRQGPWDRRRVIEVYKSIQINKDSVIIHIVGDEHGRYWDVDEYEEDKKS